MVLVAVLIAVCVLQGLFITESSVFVCPYLPVGAQPCLSLGAWLLSALYKLDTAVRCKVWSSQSLWASNPR